MSIEHHPPEEFLAGFAAGRLDQAEHIVIAAHVSMCARCRRFVAAFAPLILMSGIGYAVTPLSVLAITAMYALELLVAFIQAYVFTILTCVYLKDALHPGH